MSEPDPFAGVPVRLCVDRFLPDHLLDPAGRVAARERPRDAALMQPDAVLPEGVFRSATFTEEDHAHLIFQRIGLLRRAKWDIGRTVGIGFYPDAPRGIPPKIMAILEESSQVLNLHWRQVPVNRAEYRVAFKPGNGLWSTIGSQALMTPTGPTCNLGDVNWSDPRDLIRCVRHEIVGHGTGALHAQSLETYGQLVDLDLPGILAYYQQSQGWSYQQAKAQFDKVSNAQVEQGLQTRTSIMAYEVNPRFDRRGVGVPFNWDWDEADRTQFRQSYPYSGAVQPPTSPPPTSPPTGTDPVPVLEWNTIVALPYRGGVARAAFDAPGAVTLLVRVQEAAAGSPVLDLASWGHAPVRIPPAGTEKSDVTRFVARLPGAGAYEVQIGFRGPAPVEIKVAINDMGK